MEGQIEKLGPKGPPSPAHGATATLARDLVGLSREELGDVFAGLGESPYRVKQLWHWIYHRGVRQFSEMPTFNKQLQGLLAESCRVARPEIHRFQESADGTRKWLLGFEDGTEAETVYIPETDRGTLCISSQVGCTLTCRFCHTGTQRLVRNLTAGEIVGQMLIARDHFKEWPSPKEGRRISNVVFMGMGEPLYNYENVAQAIRILMDGEGLALSKRRITLSTAGVVPMIKRAGDDLDVQLAISLHATTDELRDELVPLNRKYPLSELIEACRTYPRAANSRRITFEYVMLKGVNDSLVDAKRLVKLIRGIPAKMNLIPFNPWPEAPYECSTPKAIAAFADVVNAAGYASPVRQPRGQDILAACGQLKSASQRQPKAAERN
ncbi:MAG: 23S rRNA (adenine(2503)-C(2))-methyltransferase RlmN [Alphaproteobacteria bacterium]|nr:23S rRNA (adenine(2503)-C(2))-methyltransferase RlmN [Alphaproteobacteria bacterium]